MREAPRYAGKRVAAFDVCLSDWKTIVMKLTDLTARQIRYYEEQELIHPERSDGNVSTHVFIK